MHRRGDSIVAERAGEHRGIASAIELIDKVIKRKKTLWWPYVGARQRIKKPQLTKPCRINGGGIGHEMRPGGIMYGERDLIILRAIELGGGQ